MPTRVIRGAVPDSLAQAARAALPGGERLTEAALIRAALAAVAKVDPADHPLREGGRPPGARNRRPRRQSGNQAAA
jgi:hypothetical protein